MVYREVEYFSVLEIQWVEEIGIDNEESVREWPTVIA